MSPQLPATSPQLSGAAESPLLRRAPLTEVSFAAARLSPLTPSESAPTILAKTPSQETSCAEDPAPRPSPLCELLQAASSEEQAGTVRSCPLRRCSAKKEEEEETFACWPPRLTGAATDERFRAQEEDELPEAALELLRELESPAGRWPPAVSSAHRRAPVASHAYRREAVASPAVASPFKAVSSSPARNRQVDLRCWRTLVGRQAELLSQKDAEIARLRYELEGGSRTTVSREEADSDLSTAAAPGAWEDTGNVALEHTGGKESLVTAPAQLLERSAKLHEVGDLQPNAQEDAAHEIACLRASIERRDAEVHRAQVEQSYLNSLLAEKDRELQQATAELTAARDLLAAQADMEQSPDSQAERFEQLLQDADAFRRARDLAQEELSRAEAQAEKMMQPLAAAAAKAARISEELSTRPAASIDGSEAWSQQECSVEAASALGVAADAGGRLLQSLRSRNLIHLFPGWRNRSSSLNSAVPF
eukprot:TRINITY_DN20499_c0_g1_i1.p1 TRINITY_DN20499_c0_g1~~TRINITY_DN20499_c0_g1_i1.p1  ORF type:complete len:479 (-),score=123.61 TRINITY_DN20499_c0_g1_i1:28-1464(-)